MCLGVKSGSEKWCLTFMWRGRHSSSDLEASPSPVGQPTKGDVKPSSESEESIPVLTAHKYLQLYFSSRHGSSKSGAAEAKAAPDFSLRKTVPPPPTLPLLVPAQSLLIIVHFLGAGLTAAETDLILSEDFDPSE